MSCKAKRLIGFSVTLLSILSPGFLLAQDSKVGMVNVRVRTLEAFDSIPENPTFVRPKHLKYEIDEQLGDLTQKLKQLHFRKYKLRSSTNRALTFEKQETLDLGDGHTLALKPLYREKNKLCLWVEWKDNSGMRIINTRLHMNVKDSMLTGTDQGDDGGMILAINVDE